MCYQLIVDEMNLMINKLDKKDELPSHAVIDKMTKIINAFAKYKGVQIDKESMKNEITEIFNFRNMFKKVFILILLSYVKV